MGKVQEPQKYLSKAPLAELIKNIRSTNELTQTAFGQLFQPPVTQSTIARWENGEQNPDKIHWPKIAFFLDLSLEKMYKLSEMPTKDLESFLIEKIFKRYCFVLRQLLLFLWY